MLAILSRDLASYSYARMGYANPSAASPIRGCRMWRSNLGFVAGALARSYDVLAKNRG
jgi:hypothetical protein